MDKLFVASFLYLSRMGISQFYSSFRLTGYAQIDIDEELLKRSLYNAEPTLSDYFKSRDHKLTVEVYRGSIDTFNECLKDVDLVYGIEMQVFYSSKL